MRKQLLIIIISLLIIGCSTPAETSPTPRSVPTAPVAAPEPAVVPEPVTPPVRTVAAPEVRGPLQVQELRQAQWALILVLDLFPLA